MRFGSKREDPLPNPFDEIARSNRVLEEMARAAGEIQALDPSGRIGSHLNAATAIAKEMMLAQRAAAGVMSETAKSGLWARQIAELNSSASLTTESLRALGGMLPAAALEGSSAVKSFLDSLDPGRWDAEIGASITGLAERLGVGPIGPLAGAIVEAVERPSSSSEEISDSDLASEAAARVEQALGPVFKLAGDVSKHPLFRLELLLSVLGILLTLLIWQLDSATDDRRALAMRSGIDRGFAEIRRRFDELREQSPHAVAYVRRNCPAREGPSSKAKKLATLHTGQHLRVREESGAWLLVEFADADGQPYTAWVFAENVDRAGQTGPQ